MKRADILHTAEKCVCGQREQDYGSPENNFQIIADFWSVYKGVKFSASDVAMMMALLTVEPRTPSWIWRATRPAAESSSRRLPLSAPKWPALPQTVIF